MATVRYNGIDLEVVEFQDYHREPIWDGPTYLYSRHRFQCLAIYNPAATSYHLPTALAQPTAANGFRGPLTDTAIRHHLMQARRELTYRVGNVTVLDSPGFNIDGNRFPVDAYNGPTPLAVDVVRVHGTKTFAVSFAVETFVNECYLFRDNPPALVSHRWRRTEDIDQDYFTTITTSGRAMFRTDLLFAIGAVPDDFRVYLLHPVPDGFKRVQVHANATEDGAVLEYVCIDRMLPMKHSITGVSRIEATHAVQTTAANFDKTIKELIMSPFTGGSFEGMLRAAGSAIVCNLPMTNVIVDAKVWGQPHSSRKDLESTAIGIILNRIGKSLNPITEYTAGKEISLMHDVAGKFVHCHCSLLTSVSTASFEGVGNKHNIPAVNIYFPDGSEATDFHDGTLLLTDTDIAGLEPPNHNGSRGAYLKAIAAQALKTPCVAHSQPALEANAKEIYLDAGEQYPTGQLVGGGLGAGLGG